MSASAGLQTQSELINSEIERVKLSICCSKNGDNDCGIDLDLEKNLWISTSGESQTLALEIKGFLVYG